LLSKKWQCWYRKAAVLTVTVDEDVEIFGNPFEEEVKEEASQRRRNEREEEKL